MTDRGNNALMKQLFDTTPCGQNVEWTKWPSTKKTFLFSEKFKLDIFMSHNSCLIKKQKGKEGETLSCGLINMSFKTPIQKFG